MKHENAIQCLQVMKGAECINALSQEFPEHYGIENIEALELAIEVLKKNRWIPCSERLPDEPEENPMFEGAKVELYLVSCGDEFYPFRVFWNGKDFTDGLCKVDAEAWMPLPEPYKEGEDGDN